MLRTHSICAAVLALQLTLATSALSDDEVLVDPQFSDLSKTELRGLKSFTVAEVRDALCRDPEAFLAAHRMAPLAKLPKVVTQRLLAGFHYAGYADAKVETEIDFDNSRLIATISEGPQYLKGTIRVINAGGVDIAQLKRCLTVAYVPPSAVTSIFEEDIPAGIAQWEDKEGRKLKMEGPLWIPGELARIDDFNVTGLRIFIGHILADLGFRDAKFGITLEPNRQTRKVDLVLDLSELSAPVTLGRIEIHGNERSSDEAIIKFLNLPLGTVMTRSRETQLRHKLWQCGRFITSDFELHSINDGGDHVLKLTVKESPYAPPIDEALSKEEQVLLKLNRWLAAPKNWTEDLVWHDQSEVFDVTIVMSPQEGFLIAIRLRKSESIQPMTLVMSRNELGYYWPQSFNYLRAPAPEGVIQLLAELYLTGELDKPFHLKSEFGFSTEKQDLSSSPIQLEVRISPAACLAIPHARNAKARWDGDVLVIESAEESWRIDGRDGRLISNNYDTLGKSHEFRFEAGAFAEALNEVHQSMKEGKNLFDEMKPFSSVFEFLNSEGALAFYNEYNELILIPQHQEITEEGRRQIRQAKDALIAWIELFFSDVFEPIEQYFTKSDDKDSADEEYGIPCSDFTSKQSMISSLVFTSSRIADDFFPRDSWAWTVWRETAFSISGHGVYTSQQLEGIYQSEEFGPVGFLVLAGLLNYADEDYARMFAERGSRIITLDEFRKDYRPFLDGDRIAGKCLRKFCETLRARSDAEVQGIADTLSVEGSAAFLAFCAELRRDKDRPVEQFISAALDYAWEAGLNQVIEKELIAIRDAQ